MKTYHEYDEDQDDEEITCGIQDVEEICETGSKKSLIESCYKGRGKEAIRDMYVPEDFQKCIDGLDTNIDECNNSHDMKKSFKATLTSTDGIRWTKHYLTSDENCEQGISETQEIGDTTNGIGNSNKNQRMICVEKFKNHENTFYKENQNGWELLDNFISGNTISGNEKCCNGDNAYKRFNSLENLSCIKRDNLLERNILHRNSNLNHTTRSMSKTTQYSDEQTKRNNITNLNQSESINCLNTRQSLSEEQGNHSVDLVEPVKKRGFNEHEKVYETKNEGTSLHARQKVNLQNTTSQPSQETTGLQMKTFEYNHGLPPLTSGVYSQMQEQPSRKILNPTEMFSHIVNAGQFDRISNNKCLGHAAGCRTPKKRIDLEKEFPPAEEIDRSVSFESQAKDYQSICFGNENGPARVCETSQLNKVFITDIASDVVETESQIGGKEFFLDKPNGKYSFVSAPFGTIKESDEMAGLYSIDEADHKQFNFNPRFIESDSSDELYSLQQNRTHELYLNPKLERISQKIYGVDGKVERNPAFPVHSLADDLRETTKKLLANNRQFSR